MARYDRQAQPNLDSFIDGELELADSFLSAVDAHVAEGRFSAARESLRSAESALDSVQSCLERPHKPDEKWRALPAFSGVNGTRTV
jgi:hypothetical protein